MAEGVQACPFGAGKPVEAFDALVTRLEERPLRVPAEGTRPEGRVDGSVLRAAAQLANFDPSTWPLLTATRTSAESGDGGLARLLAESISRDVKDGSPNGFGESLVAISCLDRVLPADPGAYDRNAEQLHQTAPRLGTGYGYVLLSCAEWSVQNPDRYLGPLTAAGALPVLVVGGREDSQTPYEWAEAMARSLPGSVLLTRDGPGTGRWGTARVSRMPSSGT